MNNAHAEWSGEMFESIILGLPRCGAQLLWGSVGSEGALCLSGLPWRCPHVTVSFDFRNKPGSGNERMASNCAFREGHSNAECGAPKKPGWLMSSCHPSHAHDVTQV